MQAQVRPLHQQVPRCGRQLCRLLLTLELHGLLLPLHPEVEATDTKTGSLTIFFQSIQFAFDLIALAKLDRSMFDLGPILQNQKLAGSEVMVLR